jgi:hypothetical protein
MLNQVSRQLLFTFLWPILKTPPGGALRSYHSSLFLFIINYDKKCDSLTLN